MPRKSQAGKGKRFAGKVGRTVRRIRNVVAPGLTTRKAAKFALNAIGAGALSSPLAGRAVRGLRGLGFYGNSAKAKTSTFENSQVYSTVSQNTTWSKVVGPARSRFAGNDAIGIKVQGSQPYCIMSIPGSAETVGTALRPDVATVSNDSIGGANYQYLCPHELGGPLAVQAMVYEQFAFRKVRITYNTRLATSSVGTMSLCYLRDPLLNDDGASGIPSTFGESRTVTPSVTFSIRLEKAIFEFTYNGDQLWYCDTATDADASDKRQCFQGQIRGFIDSVNTIGSATLAGYLTIDYEIDLFNPVPAPDSAMLLRGLTVHRDDAQAVRDFAKSKIVARQALAKRPVEAKGLPDAPLRVLELRRPDSWGALVDEEGDVIMRDLNPETPAPDPKTK